MGQNYYQSIDEYNYLSQRFDNITEIGSGGGGVVYKAYHKSLDKYVVLKKIHTELIGYIDITAERDRLKVLKHPCIPYVIDFIVYGNSVYTCMEYIEGESFGSLLDKGVRFKVEDVKKWFMQLADVIDYLHSQQPMIIHCDIKPDNLILTPSGNISLIDFNISGVMGLGGASTIGYSDFYAPAEQFAFVSNSAIYMQQSYAMQGYPNPYQVRNAQNINSGRRTQALNTNAEYSGGQTLGKTLICKGMPRVCPHLHSIFIPSSFHLHSIFIPSSFTENNAIAFWG